MQMRFSYGDGETVEATILPIDRIMFERKFGTSVVTSFTGEIHEEQVIWLGWHALKRAGKAGDDFDAWLSSLADYEVQSEPDPTGEPAATTTP